VPEPTWIDDVERFVRDSELATIERAAVFRLRARHRSALARILRIASESLMRPRPEQGLLIGREFYGRLGGHAADAAEPDTDLHRRLGRRRIAVLNSALAQTGERPS
jgi:hypothetical protein